MPVLSLDKYQTDVLQDDGRAGFFVQTLVCFICNNLEQLGFIALNSKAIINKVRRLK